MPFIQQTSWIATVCRRLSSSNCNFVGEDKQVGQGLLNISGGKRWRIRGSSDNKGREYARVLSYSVDKTAQTGDLENAFYLQR